MSVDLAGSCLAMIALEDLCARKPASPCNFCSRARMLLRRLRRFVAERDGPNSLAAHLLKMEDPR